MLVWKLLLKTLFSPSEGAEEPSFYAPAGLAQIIPGEKLSLMGASPALKC
jgi:hypothetical protein